MQALLHIMWKSLGAGTKSSSRFRIGAITTGSQWRWENSGDRVDIGPGRILKHQQDSADLSAYDDIYAYLKPVGYSSIGGYLDNLPYFDLFLEVGSDTEDEFLCMRDGEIHSFENNLQLLFLRRGFC